MEIQVKALVLVQLIFAIGAVITLPPNPITGPYDNGCYMQQITPLAFIWICPPAVTKNLVITADTSTGSTQYNRVTQFSCQLYSPNKTENCGLLFKPTGLSTNKTLDYIWVGTTTNRAKQGVTTNFAVSVVPLKYSNDQEECKYWPLWRTPVDYQYCKPGQNCYFIDANDIFIGESGVCWYAHCTPALCSSGAAKWMQDGYCLNTGGVWSCESYKTAGDACGGYNFTGRGIHPICDPFTHFCLNQTSEAGSTNVCVHSDCLDGGCRYGTACVLNNQTGQATCTGNAIINTPIGTSEAFLNEFYAPAQGLLRNKVYNLHLMARIRQGHPKAHHHLEIVSCTSSGGCPSGTNCVSTKCVSPTKSPCNPNLSCPASG